MLITFGERSRTTAAEARSAGMPPEQVVEAEDVEQVVELLRRRLRPADDVLVKGSRAMGLDAVVRAIRARGEER
jgi:UDP-N-acetylmuramoyl-tripeptide--D-alanyl-D-alanine ligase